MAGDALELFYSYARADERLRDQIHKYLRPLRREGLLYVDEKHPSLSSAQIILLLVSPDFVSSDHYMKVEVPAALRMHITGRARAIPVILRPCDWESSFGYLQALPKNGKPVTRWLNRDAAFTDIAKGIRRVIEEMRHSS